MSHFAKVENGIVTEVLVVEQDFINTGALGDPALWIQTSYNTRGCVHYDPVTREPDGGVALRGNYAVIGGTYDVVNDVFVDPQPFPSWSLDTSTWLWKPPVPRPENDNINTQKVFEETIVLASQSLHRLMFGVGVNTKNLCFNCT
jgi:hypothetical protein